MQTTTNIREEYNQIQKYCQTYAKDISYKEMEVNNQNLVYEFKFWNTISEKLANCNKNILFPKAGVNNKTNKDVILRPDDNRFLYHKNEEKKIVLTKEPELFKCLHDVLEALIVLENENLLSVSSLNNENVVFDKLDDTWKIEMKFDWQFEPKYLKIKGDGFTEYNNSLHICYLHNIMNSIEWIKNFRNVEILKTIFMWSNNFTKSMGSPVSRIPNKEFENIRKDLKKHSKQVQFIEEDKKDVKNKPTNQQFVKKININNVDKVKVIKKKC